jgi:hypothetical protein
MSTARAWTQRPSAQKGQAMPAFANRADAEVGYVVTTDGCQVLVDLGPVEVLCVVCSAKIADSLARLGSLTCHDHRPREGIVIPLVPRGSPEHAARNTES